MCFFFYAKEFGDIMKLEYLILNFDFLKNEKGSWSEIKNIFLSFISNLF